MKGKIIITVIALLVIIKGHSQCGTADPGFAMDICEGDVLTLSAINPTSGQWFGPGNIACANCLTTTVSNLSAGPYVFTWQPTNPCFAAGQVFFTVHPSPLVTATASKLTICAGEQVTISASGASTYNWDNGLGVGQNHVVNPATTTTYNVTGSTPQPWVATGNCSGSASVTITVAPAPTVTATSNSSVCEGGTLNLNETGGDLTNWNWSGPNGFSSNQQNPSITNVTAYASGNYTVSGTNVNGCPGNATVNVVINPPFTVTPTSNSPLCEGDVLNLNETGGNLTNWSWNGPNGFSSSQQNPTINNVTTNASGNYMVSGTDGNGCQGSGNVNVTISSSPTVTVNASNNPICEGDLIFLNASGATTYSWNGGIWVGSGIADVPLTTTNYVVTGSTGNCSGQANVTVIVNPLPIVVPIANNPLCEGGTLNLSETGGVCTSWNWDGPNGFSSSIQNPSISSVTASAAGLYTVLGMDNNGCSWQNDVNVSINNCLSAGFNASSTSLCEGDCINFTDASTNSPVTWHWYFWGTTGFNIANPNIANPITVQNPSNICYPTAGTYGVSLFIDDGTNTDSLYIANFITVDASGNANAGNDQVLCSGDPVNLSAVSPVAGTWIGPGTIQNATSPNTIVTGLTVGATHTFTWTPTNTCMASDNVLVTINAISVADAGADQVVCGSSVNLSAVSPAAGMWSGPGTINNPTNGNTNVTGLTVGTTHTFTWTPTDPCIVPEVTDVTTQNCLASAFNASNTNLCENDCINFTDLSTGGTPSTWRWYFWGATGFNVANPVTVQNPNNICYPNAGTYDVALFIDDGTNTDSLFITNYVTVNAYLNSDAGSNQTICLGQTIQLQVLSQLIGSWTGPGVGEVISNPNIHNPVVTNLPAGTHNFTWSPTGNCINSDIVQIVVNPIGNANAGPDQVLCSGASVNLSAVSPIAGTWSGPGIIQNPNDPNSSITGLTTGTHIFTWTPSDPCITADNIQITINSSGVADAGTDQDLCFGDPINLLAITPMSGIWSGPGLINTPNTNTTSVSSLSAATHTFTWTPTNTCITPSTVDVTINSLPSVSAGADQTICLGDAVTLNGSGAGTYTWDNGVTDGNPFSPTTTTTYEVEGTDGNGCVNTDQIVVNVNSLPTVIANASSTSICPGDAVNLSGSGASTYVWDNGLGAGQSFIVNPAVTTTYNVTGTDLNGCENISNVTVTVNPSPTVNGGPNQTICLGETVTLTGNGATNYTWSNGVVDGVPFTPLVTTTYKVTGTNGVGCDGIDFVRVVVDPLPNVGAGTDQTICLGDVVVLTGSGATSYSWDNGVTDGNPFSPSATNTYTVTGTDMNGCINTDQVNVNVNSLPTVIANASSTSICPGESVTLSGSAASTYAWDNGLGTGQSFIVNPAVTTTYNVTGTDLNGCENTSSVTIMVNPSPTVNAGLDQIICLGDVVTLTGSGATSYSWDNGVTDGVAFNPSVTTTYTVTGTSGVGCDGLDQVTITVNPLPNVGAGLDQTICTGDAVTLNGSGAGIYTWDNGVTDGNPFSPTTTTTYEVEGTDGNGCVNTDQIVVNVNSLPTVIANASNTSICPGDAVNLSGSGASTYVWDNGLGAGQSFVVTPSATTTYTVTGTDLNGCENTSNVTITVNPSPTVNGGPDQTICLGDAVTLLGSGATNYTWSNGVVDGVAFSPTTTTTYTVTGTSGVGCDGVDQVTVTVNPLPVVTASSNSVVCEGATLTLNETGGDATIWGWTGPNSYASTNQNPSITNIALSGAGTYTVTGTDVNGCVNSDQMNVTVNALPMVVANANSMSICPGEAVTLSGSGASTYSWDNGLGSGQSFVVTPASTTTYTVTGIDGNGCENTSNVTVTVNPSPTVNGGLNQTICLGETVTLTGNGATNYTWSNGVVDGVAFSPTTTTTYTVTGTSGVGCDGVDQVTVTVNPLPVVTAISNSPICEGGTLSLSETGGAATTWSWSGPNGYTSTNQNSAITNVPLNGSGTYTVIGIDGNGCVNNDQMNVSVNALPTVVTNASSMSICPGESVTLSGSGANAYSWDNGLGSGQSFVVTPASATTYTVTGTDVNGCINTDMVTITINPEPIVTANASSTSICLGESVILTGSGATSYNWDNNVIDGVAFTPLSTTTYTVLGTDGNGCDGTDQITITVNPLPIINAGTDLSVCDGHSVILTGAGSTYPYTWDNGVVDGVAFIPLTTNTYTASVTDANNCIGTDQVLVTVNPLPNITANSNSAVCEGDDINLSEAGVDASQWLWYGPNNFSSNLQNPVIVNANVAAFGQYKVIGTGIGGCKDSNYVTVTINALPAIIVNSNSPICEGEDINLSETGGDAIAWNWTGPNGFTSSSVITAVSNATTNTAGIYTVTGTDGNGCNNTANTNVAVGENPVLSIQSATDVSCFEGNDGTITLAVAGNLPLNNYSFLWNDPNNQVTATASNLKAGTYSCTVTNINTGCNATISITITEPAPLAINIDNITNVSCNGGNDGSTTVAVSGGTMPVSTYLWVPTGQASSTANNLLAGNHKVYVTDAMGCIDSADITISEPQPLIANASASIHVSCNGFSDGIATVNVSGGTMPIQSYSWTPSNQSTAIATGLPAGIHMVTVTDTNNCITTDTTLVNEPQIKFLRVPGSGIIKISIDDIIYIETNKDYVKIHGKDFFYKVASPLTSLITRLDSKIIKRVHRSFAININMINYIEKDQIYLEKKSKVISLGTTYKRKFLDSLLIIGDKKPRDLMLG